MIRNITAKANILMDCDVVMADDGAGFSSFPEFPRHHGLEPDNLKDEEEEEAILEAQNSFADCRSDTKDSLGTIRRRSQASISSTLISIQKLKLPQGQIQRWIESLECLCIFSGRRTPRNDTKIQCIRRGYIDPRRSPAYIAVSYTWDPSHGEAETTGGYHIETRVGQGFAPTKLRDNVVDRVIKYAQHHKVNYFWIDQECINQADTSNKELAMQSMDMVYHLSRFPIALLSFRIDDVQTLNLLTGLLCGIFVSKNTRLTSCAKKVNTIENVLEMLRSIVVDRWWTRAWTFQEDYQAGMEMELLFSHANHLEMMKVRWSELLGDLKGELCVSSVDFRTEATRFCLAYKAEQRHKYGNVGICDLVLQRAGKYTVLLENRSPGAHDTVCSPMSPRIFADLDSRGREKEFDILAIAANMCNYSVRLDSNRLEAGGYSLSLAILALSLMNGEIPIYYNQSTIRQSGPADLSDNVMEFLHKNSLSSLRSPTAQKLTFAKHCRLVNVNLTPHGIETRGHVWRLGRKVILGSGFEEHPRDQKYEVGLSSIERSWMEFLVWELKSGNLGKRYTYLATKIEGYLEEDRTMSESTTAKEFKDWMARDIIEAMRTGRELQLASIMDTRKPNQFSNYCGIFVDSIDKGFKNVFTSWGERDSFVKHVSMGVTLQQHIATEAPRMEPRSWVNGLFFFSTRQRQTHCVIPWPNAFMV
jgi:hypothetical protein